MRCGDGTRGCYSAWRLPKSILTQVNVHCLLDRLYSNLSPQSQRGPFRPPTWTAPGRNDPKRTGKDYGQWSCTFPTGCGDRECRPTVRPSYSFPSLFPGIVTLDSRSRLFGSRQVFEVDHVTRNQKIWSVPSSTYRNHIDPITDGVMKDGKRRRKNCRIRDYSGSYHKINFLNGTLIHINSMGWVSDLSRTPETVPFLGVGKGGNNQLSFLVESRKMEGIRSGPGGNIQSSSTKFFLKREDKREWQTEKR